MSVTLLTSTTEIAAYYDADCEHCLSDFVAGNTRVEAATEFVLSHLKARRTRRVLEVGCGIGSSSHAVCQECPEAEVVGVDISEKRIGVARKLFPHPRLQFQVATMETIPVSGLFDAIVMLDVYEHIPAPRVAAFNGVLARMLSPDGIILVTTPSPLHQARLAASNPAGLQIVDETIGAEEITRLARDVGGTVTSFAYRTVWHTNDYVHSVIERAPRYERRAEDRTPLEKAMQKLPRLWRMMRAGRSRSVRAAMVHQRLGIQVSKTGAHGGRSE